MFDTAQVQSTKVKIQKQKWKWNKLKHRGKYVRKNEQKLHDLW